MRIGDKGSLELSHVAMCIGFVERFLESAGYELKEGCIYLLQTLYSTS